MMMTELLWRIVAFIVSRGPIASWLIRRAQRTPYTHITGRHDGDVYMRRYWLFNAYRKDERREQLPARWPWLPSVRVHHILRPDDDDPHLHSHPWDARTIILHGGYIEEKAAKERPGLGLEIDSDDVPSEVIRVLPDGPFGGFEQRTVHTRERGYTGRLKLDSFHRISHVMPGGAITLFFTWGTSKGWGFKVGDRVVPHREYLGIE